VDVQTGRNAGTRTILLSTGEGGRDAKYDVLPDFKAADLLDATEIVLS
jgi:phosphoglycolate phosphatase-like HAD superfamily hydrolase